MALSVTGMIANLSEDANVRIEQARAETLADGQETRSLRSGRMSG